MLAYFESNGAGRDVLISDVYAACCNNFSASSDPRVQQQHVGAVISKINRKLGTRIIPGSGKRGARIVPGLAKRTYRLVPVE